jgi:hypothetical protein
VTNGLSSTRAKIQHWINAIQVIIIVILFFQTFACYVQPDLLYGGLRVEGAAMRQAITVLAGRNAMMAVVSIWALVSQNPRLLLFAFVMHFLREGQDMFIVPLTPIEGAPPPVLNFFMFLVPFVIPEALALNKLRKLVAEQPAN